MFSCSDSRWCFVCYIPISSARVTCCKTALNFAYRRVHYSMMMVSSGVYFNMRLWDSLTGQCLLDLLEYDNPDLHASFGGSLEHIVQTVLVVLRWRSAKVQLGGQPPIENVNALLGLCDGVLQLAHLRRTAQCSSSLWQVNQPNVDSHENISYLQEPQRAPRSKRNHRRAI